MRSPARIAAALSALAAGAVVACADVPFVPRWDADWYVPLPSQSISLPPYFPSIIVNPGDSADVSFPDQALDLQAAIGDLLQQTIRSANVSLELRYTISLGGNATLVVAGSQADLGNASATRIVFPMTLNPATRSASDTITVTSAGIQMIASAANSGNPLWVRFTGRVRYQGSSPDTLSSTDTLGVRAALLTRIAVSR